MAGLPDFYTPELIQEYMRSARKCKNPDCNNPPTYGGFCTLHIREQNLEVRQSQFGLGLFATDRRYDKSKRRTGNLRVPFRAGDEVCKYYGYEIPEEVLKTWNDAQCEYVIEILPGRFVDAPFIQNCLGRFVNSPKNTGLEANVRFARPQRIIYEQPFTRLIAIRDIEPGEQIYADYSENGWYVPLSKVFGTPTTTAPSPMDIDLEQVPPGHRTAIMENFSIPLEDLHSDTEFGMEEPKPKNLIFGKAKGGPVYDLTGFTAAEDIISADIIPFQSKFKYP